MGEVKVNRATALVAGGVVLALLVGGYFVVRTARYRAALREYHNAAPYGIVELRDRLAAAEVESQRSVDRGGPGYNVSGLRERLKDAEAARDRIVDLGYAPPE